MGQFFLRLFEFVTESLFLPEQGGDGRLQLTEFFCTGLIGTLPFRQVFVQFLESGHFLLQYFPGGVQVLLKGPVLFQFRL